MLSSVYFYIFIRQNHLLKLLFVVYNVQRLLSARRPSPCADIYTVVLVHVSSLGLMKAWASDINQPPVTMKIYSHFGKLCQY